MHLQSDRTAPDKRASGTANNSVTRWTVRPDSKAGAGNGWMWVGALLVAALFIVSGYLDEESRRKDDSTATAGDQRYASGNATGGMPATKAGSVNTRTDKGY